MKNNEPENNVDNGAQTGHSAANCSQCGKPVASTGRVGSLTSYLFQSNTGNTCVCHRTSSPGKKSTAVGANKGDVEFCPRCGLEKVSKSQAGSLTGYLFQHTRCRCQQDAKFDSAAMSQKFWKLKEQGRITSSSSFDKERSGGGVHVDLIKGAIIGGAYRIIKAIGRGGMGEVYLAEQITMGKECALKVIPPEQVTEMGWLRFQNEAKIFAKLQHPNLVRVFDLGIHEGCLPFYAMDFVSGDTVADLLQKNGPMPLPAAIEIFSQVCDGVDYAHRNGVIHRDLKPANIMIERRRSSDKMAVRVLDFGLAKLVQRDRESQSLTAVGEVFGSPFYMSPEQCTGRRIDNRSDVYSVGCSLFECLTGRPPFDGNQAVTITEDHVNTDPPSLEDVVGSGVFPDSIEVVLAKLLRKNPAERYQTLAELKGDLERVLRGESVEPFYVSRTRSAPLFEEPEEVLPSFMPRNAAPSLNVPRSWIVAGVVALISATIAATTFFVFIDGSKGTGTSHMPETKLQSPFVESTSEEKSKSIPAEEIKDTLVKWDGKPYFRGYETHSGLRMRTWSFPIDPYGANWGLFIDTKSADFGLTGLAGKKTATLDTTAAVELMSCVLLSPDLLKGFTDGNIDQLRFKELKGGELDKIVDGLAQLKSMSDILFDFHAGGSRKKPSATYLPHVVRAMNTFPNLRTVKFILPVDGAVIAEAQGLRKLKSIDLNGPVTNVSALIERLGGSTALQTLIISDPVLSIGDVRNIAKCPNLHRLDINLEQIDKTTAGEKLRVLAAAKGLKILTVSHVPETRESIEALKAFSGQGLNQLEINESGNWSTSSKVILKSYLPKTTIQFAWSQKGQWNKQVI